MIVLDNEIYNDKQVRTNVYLGVCFNAEQNSNCVF